MGLLGGMRYYIRGIFFLLMHPNVLLYSLLPGAISYVGYGVLHDYGMKTYHYYMNLMTTETSTAWYYVPIRLVGKLC